MTRTTKNDEHDDHRERAPVYLLDLHARAGVSVDLSTFAHMATSGGLVRRHPRRVGNGTVCRLSRGLVQENKRLSLLPKAAIGSRSVPYRQLRPVICLAVEALHGISAFLGERGKSGDDSRSSRTALRCLQLFVAL